MAGLSFVPTAQAPLHWLSKDLRARFGGPVTKACLDAGFTCPNRDGTRGWGGCLWCDPGGSGPDDLRPGEDWEARLRRLAERALSRGDAGVIAYFQAFTATYAAPSRLRGILERALEVPGVVALAVGTRPDCLSPETLDLLSRTAERRFLWVEVGMQTAKDETLRAMNRGHGFSDTEEACGALRARGLPFVLHLIAGLPGENEAEVKRSHALAVALGCWGLKIHPLHVVEGSPLAAKWRRGEVLLWERERYVRLVADLLEATPPCVTLHRLTGERPEGVLLAPAWCRDKRKVLRALQRELATRRSFQGKALASESPAPF